MFRENPTVEAFHALQKAAKVLYTEVTWANFGPHNLDKLHEAYTLIQSVLEEYEEVTEVTIQRKR